MYLSNQKVLETWISNKMKVLGDLHCQIRRLPYCRCCFDGWHLAGSDTIRHASVIHALYGFIAVSEVWCKTVFVQRFIAPATLIVPPIKLPYFDGCVQEALRLFSPVASGICISPSYRIDGLYCASYQGFRNIVESCIQILNKVVPPRTTATQLVTFPSQCL